MGWVEPAGWAGLVREVGPTLSSTCVILSTGVGIPSTTRWGSSCRLGWVGPAGWAGLVA